MTVCVFCTCPLSSIPSSKGTATHVCVPRTAWCWALSTSVQPGCPGRAGLLERGHLAPQDPTLPRPMPLSRALLLAWMLDGCVSAWSAHTAGLSGQLPLTLGGTLYPVLLRLQFPINNQFYLLSDQEQQAKAVWPCFRPTARTVARLLCSPLWAATRQPWASPWPLLTRAGPPRPFPVTHQTLRT